MKTLSVSHAGSIREENQDYIHCSKQLKLAILVDGSGPEGAISAKSAAETIEHHISEFAHLSRLQESSEFLTSAVAVAKKHICERYGKYEINIAVIWINKGFVVGYSDAKCKILRLEKDGLIFTSQTTRTFQKRAVFGSSYLLASEGAAISLSATEIKYNVKHLLENFCKDSLKRLESRLAAVYDGDDRTVMIVKCEEEDLIYFKEIELITHIDREFSLPVWAWLSAFTAFAGSLLLLLRPIYKIYKRFC